MCLKHFGGLRIMSLSTVTFCAVLMQLTGIVFSLPSTLFLITSFYFSSFSSLLYFFRTASVSGTV